MATEFNTQVGDGEYRLQFETDNQAHYLFMQSAARRCIDCAHMTNADKIRSMSDAELYVLFREIYNAGVVYGVSYMYGKQPDNFEWKMKWLMQPAEEGKRKDNSDDLG